MAAEYSSPNCAFCLGLTAAASETSGGLCVTIFFEKHFGRKLQVLKLNFGAATKSSPSLLLAIGRKRLPLLYEVERGGGVIYCQSTRGPFNSISIGQIGLSLPSPPPLFHRAPRTSAGLLRAFGRTFIFSLPLPSRRPFFYSPLALPPQGIPDEMEGGKEGMEGMRGRRRRRREEINFQGGRRPVLP